MSRKVRDGCCQSKAARSGARINVEVRAVFVSASLSGGRTDRRLFRPMCDFRARVS